LRCLVLILLVALASGDDSPERDPSLLEPRAWRGVIEVAGRNTGKEITRGEETQRERIEFVLVTEPPRTSVGWPRLPFRMREGRGTYEIHVDVREGADEGALTSRGDASGDLFPRVSGHVEPTTGKYRLALEIQPSSLAVVGTVTTMIDGRFVAHRTAGQRPPFLAGFAEEGDVEEGGRVIRGRRTLEDRRGGVVRQADIAWRLERLDAAVRGRVEDHLGRPVASMKVLARFQNAERLRQRLPPILREGRTDELGHFRIEAFHGAWAVELVGEERMGLLVAGRFADDLVQVRFDDVPDLDLRVAIYRLEALPQTHLLRGHFQGDVGAYLAYIRERVPATVLDRALDQAEGAPAAGR
jgi:hypothetical protein